MPTLPAPPTSCPPFHYPTWDGCRSLAPAQTFPVDHLLPTPPPPFVPQTARP
ncbi:hypothetical protein ACIRBX_16485 [Kitasatospora sp. NPDC096147]|uniref:hypothetical protein n=1 Tax=Kitasatospora sp. NPDC096147 TaxID=3364093 RepID=UPI00380D7867